MSQQDLESMTVVALKRELKARNLPMTGNKNDLVQRLSNSLTSGTPHALDMKTLESATGLPATTTIFTEATISSSVGSGQPKIPIAPENSEKKPVADTTSKVTHVTQNAQNTVSTSAPAPKPAADENLSEEQLKAEAKHATEQSDTKAILSESERKILRAKKFNISVVQTKEMRAERFGISKQTSAEKSSFNSASVSASSDQLKKRAERFGLLTSTTQKSSLKDDTQTEKLKQRSLRFGLGVSSANGDKKNVHVAKVSGSEKQSDVLLKRKERFDSSVTQDSVADKKRLRAERFGLKS